MDLGEPAPTRVVLGRGVFEEVLPFAASAACTLVVADAGLRELQWARRALGVLGEASTRMGTEFIEADEGRKSVETAQHLWRSWMSFGAGRDALVVALGGGIISDLAGFAAACFHRGLAWVATPTTTLAMADAAIGGKTGVNLDGGKNLVGALHHPRLVVADTAFLETLGDRAHADGFAEVIKAGVIGDATLFDACERLAASVRRRDETAVADLLFGALHVKASVVRVDAREAAQREILNFGHTLGHALERASAHALSHGEAVAIGIVAESRVAVRRGRLPADAPARIAAACGAMGLPTTPPPGLSRAAMQQGLVLDKKRRQGELRVALPSGWGAHDPTPSVAITTEELLDALW
jgi:3-dehydroquinate synthase